MATEGFIPSRTKGWIQALIGVVFSSIFLIFLVWMSVMELFSGTGFPDSEGLARRAVGLIAVVGWLYAYERAYNTGLKALAQSFLGGLRSSTGRSPDAISEFADLLDKATSKELPPSLTGFLLVCCLAIPIGLLFASPTTARFLKTDPSTLPLAALFLVLSILTGAEILYYRRALALSTWEREILRKAAAFVPPDGSKGELFEPGIPHEFPFGPPPTTFISIFSWALLLLCGVAATSFVGEDRQVEFRGGATFFIVQLSYLIGLLWLTASFRFFEWRSRRTALLSLREEILQANSL